MSIDEAKTELATFLNGTKASDFEVCHKEVIEVSVSMTPTEAAKLLWKNKVIGAPVWDEQTKSYVGFFDMRDMLSTVIASHKEEMSKQEGNKDHIITKWFSKDEKNSDSSGGGNFSVKYLAARNPFVSLTNDATLMDVFKLCAKRHFHRVPIVDNKTGRCVRILSQSALVKYVVDHLLAENKSANIKHFFNRTLDEANFPYKKKVMAAPDTATASDVFELMDNHRLSGIAVVDSDDGALIGNTSASDIKLAVAVDDGVLASLDLNIVSYLSAVRQEDPTKEAKYPSSHVKESSTLGHAIKLIAKTGYHRVFVCDAEVKPVGVVSVSDIVANLVDQIDQSNQ